MPSELLNHYDPHEVPLVGGDALAFDLAITLKTVELAQAAPATGIQSGGVGSPGRQPYPPGMGPQEMAALKRTDLAAWHRASLQQRGFNRIHR